MVKTESCNSYKKSGIILALYCVRYPHAMLFLRHKILYYLLKPSKPHHFYGVWNSQCPKFRKFWVKILNYTLLLDFLALFSLHRTYALNL